LTEFDTLDPMQWSASVVRRKNFVPTRTIISTADRIPVPHVTKTGRSFGIRFSF
jgi:hypothetical protein